MGKLKAQAVDASMDVLDEAASPTRAAKTPRRVWRQVTAWQEKSKLKSPKINNFTHFFTNFQQKWGKRKLFGHEICPLSAVNLGRGSILAHCIGAALLQLEAKFTAYHR